jgi:hypothetical protein
MLADAAVAALGVLVFRSPSWAGSAHCLIACNRGLLNREQRCWSVPVLLVPTLTLSSCLLLLLLLRHVLLFDI